MGACISVHHKASAMKVQLSFDSTNKPDHKVVIHPSPSDEKLQVKSDLVPVKAQLPPPQSLATFSEFGSKEETFFDSQGWLDSDYEDEFMSVNGEFTPSRGNTPVHHSLTLGTPQVNVLARTTSTGYEPHGSTLEPSPTSTEKKMKLLDLFKESVRENNGFDEDNAELLNQVDPKKKSTSRVGSLRGCFSSMLYVRGSGKQKNKTLIPSPSPSLIVG